MNNIDKMHRQCFSKKKFISEKSAKKEIRRILEEYGKQARYYTCPVCGWLHITTKEINHE